MQTFYLPTKILSGEGALGQVLLGKKRIFIVTDRFMHDSGRTDYVTKALEEGAVFEIFSDVKPDPDIATVSQGAQRLLAFSPDLLIALGGGSPIDAAKAMLFFARRQKDLLGPCPFAAIPTTSGTGSEVSRFAVVTDGEKGVKYPLVDDQLIPDFAILDPALLTSLPPSVTADTGIDVLTHAIEAFVSTERTDFSDAMAEKAIRLVYRYLLRAYREPENLAYRSRMLDASCLAGAAFSNAGLGINHSMAHALGARLHLSHGRANGILLPYVMSFNAGCTSRLTKTADRYAKLGRVLGLETASTRQSALNVIRAARRFMEALEMPASIRELGVSQADFEQMLPELARTALADRCTRTSPETVTFEDLCGVYRQAWSGKWW